MNYQITVKRVEANPNFAAEVEDFERNNRNRNGYGPMDMRGEYPQAEVVKNMLLCELTEEEYRSVKKSVLEVFK